MINWWIIINLALLFFQKRTNLKIILRNLVYCNQLQFYEIDLRRKVEMDSFENSSSIMDQTSSYMNGSNVTSKYECEDPYPNQKEILSSVSWWLDGFIQIIIGCMGFAGNTIAIPVLSSRKLSSIFNRILVFLAGINLQRLFYL